MNKVTFNCIIYKFQGDKEGEGKIVLTIPQSDIAEVAKFYVENTEKLIIAALVSEDETEKENK